MRCAIPIVFFAILLAPVLSQGELLVARGSSWRYAKGTAEASDPRGEWRSPDFDDAGWATGKAPFGYGDAPFGTTLTDMQGSYSSFFIRRSFTVSELLPDTRLRAAVDYDDGYIVWINGERVSDKDEPDGAPLYDSLASGDHESGVYETNDLPDPEDYLELGVNVMAVQVFNVSPSSSDCKIDVELSTYKRVADTTFSHDRGFYDASFTVTIATATAGATIRYTTDGSRPTATHGTSGGTNAVLQITTTTCLRAAAFKGGYEPTNADAHTYIFLSDVKNQSNAPPPGYPSYWGTNSWAGSEKLIPLITADYGMHPPIVNDSRYTANWDRYFKAVPTLSIVMEHAHAFDPTIGLLGGNYIPVHQTYDYEYPCSAELIYPAGYPGDVSGGFQIDCGVSTFGNDEEKRSLKLLFKSEYGPGKLRYPFFESAPLNADSAVDRYDRIYLRGGSNRSLAGWMPERQEKTTGTREQWMRDSQLDMSGAGFGTHGTFMHLYVNGLYWGLYNPVERPDAWHTSAYFGGEQEDWYAVSHRSEKDGLPGISGDATRYRYFLSTLAVKDMSVPANYAEMQQYLNVPPFIDYVMLYWYSGAGDWQDNSFNNFYAGNRNVPEEPILHFVWDAESCWFDSAPAPMNNNKRSNDGAWIKPQFLTSAEGSHAPYNAVNHRHFARPFRAMQANADFRTLWADRLYQHLNNDGRLTDASSQARWTALCDFVEDAWVPETARWGEMMIGRTNAATPYTVTVYTRHDHWYNARDEVLAMMSGNGDRLINLCRNQTLNGYKLYPSIDPPGFHPHGGAIASGFKLTMSKAYAAATIYYTVDGSDPRMPGGSRSATCLPYAAPFTLSRTTHVKARLYKSNSTWSAAHAATYNYTGHYSNIKITEIHYNPLGGSDYEFIEIKNTGSATRGLSEMTVRGVRYTFPPGAELGGGKLAVLVANEAAFTNRYPGVKGSAGVQFFDAYPGSLDNGGERIALLDSEGRTVTAVRYNDKAPWPTAADGDGYSLVVVDENAEPDDPANWRASNLIGGSPGYEDGPPFRVVINEALTHTDLPQVDAIELHNAGDAAVEIGGWHLSDSVADYKKFQIPGSTTLAAGQYAVFYENTHFGTNVLGPVKGFALDSHGDEIYLTQWDAAGNLLYLAEARFGGAENGVAFGRYVTSAGDADFVAQSTTNTLGTANAPPKVGPIVINELMYHPSDSSDFEFVELHNISDGVVPLYDASTPTNTWRLGAAVDYAFAPGTSLAAREYVLVVATNEAAFRARYPSVPGGVRVFGPYTGRLGNGGESVKLWRPDTSDAEGVPWILVDRVQYDDNSPWPESADGAGPSLERQDARVYGNDPANWAASVNAGGTPGAPNSGGLVSKAAGWKYHDRGEDLGTAWRAAAYDDTGWSDGNAPLGYADPGYYPELDTVVSYGDDPANKRMTTYFRKSFTLAAAPGTVTNLALYAKYDDGFVAYLNGEEVARGSMPGGAVTYTTVAVGHTAADYEPFDLSAHAAKLVQGRNVLAVEVHQSDAASSDLFMDIELAHAASAGNPPAAPQNLTASAVSQTRINLAWQDASDNEIGFRIDRRRSGTQVWEQIATTAANASTHGDTGLAAGTTYYFMVKAYNADGNSPYSSVAAATTHDGPPAAPSALAASAESATRIALRWTDNSGNETGFKIERSPDGSSGWAQIGTVGADGTVYTDPGLVPATAYYYRVRATNAAGDSGYSNVGGATCSTLYVRFAAAASSGAEHASPVTLSVTLSEPSWQTVGVSYAATGGTAVGGGADYTLASGTLSFGAGQTGKEVSVTVVDDANEEPAETIVVTLSSPSNAALGTPSAHTYTIIDNDNLFEAYNDLCWANGQTAANITLYTRGQGGLLVDYGTGQTTPVTLTLNAGGEGPYLQGADAAAGTDADAVFAGIVDCAGLISYGPTDLTLTFTGLDAALRYEFVLFGNRDNAAYTDRTTLVTISDVAGFRNASSAGAIFTGSTDPTVRLFNGGNTANGRIARFDNVAAGPDGDMVITLSDNDSRFYANALMLKATRAEAGGSTTRDEPIASSAEDAEQYLDTGQTWTNSSDLELIYESADGGHNQAVGLRFRNLAVPKGARIESAFVQFKADETHSAATALTIEGHAIDDAPPFSNTSENITARSRTAASVAWNPPAWTAGDTGPAQRTPDIRTVIQEIVDRASWTSGNALVLVVTGSGQRVAVSCDADPAGAARLELAYSVGGLPDDDADGIADAWETAYFGGTNAAGGGESDDPDGDGLNNWGEFVAGTHPTNEASCFTVELQMAGSGLRVSFATLEAAGTGYANRTRRYELQANDTPESGAWTAVPGYASLPATGSDVTYTNLSPPGSVYYRARVWLE
ncbi:MAG: lamin tail domain-containing protein [Kiritimatiellae bacterium]|nr:lamin tail domain-containing protein [Kiritimatiellia bacterium]